MKGLRKVTAVMITVFMVASMLSIAVLAEDGEKESINTETEEILGDGDNTDIEAGEAPIEEKTEEDSEVKEEEPGDETGEDVVEVSPKSKELTPAQTPMSASVTATGTCGDNLTWTLEDDGVLTISGSGAMNDYDEFIDIYQDKIKRVVIQSGVTSIGHYAFDNCDSLKEVVIPSSVISIGYRAFYNCDSLKEVVIPSSVISIGYSAFEECTSLEEVNIPSSVTDLGMYAFWKCSSLKKATIPSSVSLISDASFGNTALTEITIPSGITYIGQCAFLGTNITTVTIPASVTGISAAAFADTKLTSIYFMGDAPRKMISRANTEFDGVTANAYFPYNNTTWTENDEEHFNYRNSYGGSLTWMAWNPENDLAINLSLTDSIHWIASGSDATIVCTGEYGDFVSAAMDGVLMDSSHYSAKEGSTVLTIMSQYLDTLSVGDHKVTLNYTYGSIDTNLKILDRGTSTTENSSSSAASVTSVKSSGSVAAATGDESTTALWLFAVCVSGSVLLALKKKKMAS